MKELSGRCKIVLLAVMLLPLLAFGYSCGTWFSFDAEMENGVEEAASRSDGAHIERTFVLRKKELNPTWNLVRIVRRGEVASSERIEIVGRKPGVAIIIW
jgi:hypothetical protein